MRPQLLTPLWQSVAFPSHNGHQQNRQSNDSQLKARSPRLHCWLLAGPATQCQPAGSNTGNTRQPPSANLQIQETPLPFTTSYLSKIKSLAVDKFAVALYRCRHFQEVVVGPTPAKYDPRALRQGEVFIGCVNTPLDNTNIANLSL